MSTFCSIIKNDFIYLLQCSLDVFDPNINHIKFPKITKKTKVGLQGKRHLFLPFG